jgi:hypothetical protein
MSAPRPSKPWRVVFTTPGAAVYEPHRSRPAAYRAVEAEKERVADGTSRTLRMAVDQWDTDGQRWQRYENVWSQDDPA